MKIYIQFFIVFILTFATASFCKAEDSIPVMNFQEVVHDFGEVKQGEVVTHEFKFTNVGKDVLLITDVITTCGCTVPKYPEGPIKPNTPNILYVSFDTKNKIGIQRKTITIKTNQGTFKLRILVNVIM